MEFILKSEVEKFEEYLVFEEKSGATIEKYKRDIIAFLNWTGKDEADKKSVLKYKAYLIENYAPCSVNSILSSLNSFFDFCGYYELKTKMLKVPKKIFLSKEKELTRGEYNRLLDAAQRNKKLYYLMQTICSSGIRVSELKYITVEALRERQAVIKCKGKMRCILLPGKLCKMLLKYVKNEGIKKGSVFVTKSGKPLDRSNIWKMMKKLCENTGIDKQKVFPHNLRHLFARTYYCVQKDIVRLADLLGHSSINTTRIYTMETGDIHREQIQSLGLLRI